jgi:hypothetical protein
VLARFAGLSDGYGDGDDDHHQVPPRRTRHISMQHSPSDADLFL